MPTKQAAFKSLRQSKKHAQRNIITKLGIADAIRAVKKAISAKDLKKAQDALKKAVKLLDKAYSRGIMKLNAVSRKKSRLMKSVKGLVK